MIPYWLIQLTQGVAPTLFADLCETFYVPADSSLVVGADYSFSVSADLGSLTVTADPPAFTVPGCA